MDDSLPGLAKRAPRAALLGYLNFSDGRPDPSSSGPWTTPSPLLARGGERPVGRLGWLARRPADALHAAGAAAFRDVAQAQAVLDLRSARPWPPTASTTRDLLAHQTDADLFSRSSSPAPSRPSSPRAARGTSADRIVAGAVRG